MRLCTPMIRSTRLLVLAWTVIWVATVPLFHTHLPDNTEKQTPQRGIAHTVFSPDLPGEFFRFSSAHQSPFAQLSKRVSNSPELGFVFSSSGDSTDREVGQSDIFGLLNPIHERPFLLASAIESYTADPRAPVFAAPHDPRAPPSVVSL